MNDKLYSRFFSQVVEKMTRNRNVFGAALCVENGDRSVSWAGASGDINENDRYFIASVTKLCVSMFILHLRAEKRLSLDDRISKYLPDEMLQGLHVMDGVEYTGEDLADAFAEYIFDKLELKNTYAYTDISDSTPVPMYYKSNKIHIPVYITSITAQGGLISTSRECMVLLKAFFNGRFFQAECIEELKEWKFIAFPGNFYFGIGLEKLWIPRIYSPFRPIGEYFAGTVNQLTCGISLGGWVVNLHRCYYNSSNAYVPLLSGAYLGELFLKSKYRKLASPREA